MITGKEIKQDLLEVGKKLGKRPSKRDYKECGLYGINTVVRRFGTWNAALLDTFGSVNCSPKPGYTKECSNCGKEIHIVPSQDRGNNFCSSSCAAIFNNKKAPKRKKEGECKDCGVPIRASRSYCTNCLTERMHTLEKRTLREIVEREIGKKASTYSSIRCAARRILKNTHPMICAVCGYTKHVEAVHKRPIGDFPMDTLVSEINDHSNLIWLCRNHHWEFDHCGLEL